MWTSGLWISPEVEGFKNWPNETKAGSLWSVDSLNAFLMSLVLKKMPTWMPVPVWLSFKPSKVTFTFTKTQCVCTWGLTNVNRISLLVKHLQPCFFKKCFRHWCLPICSWPCPCWWIAACVGMLLLPVDQYMCILLLIYKISKVGIQSKMAKLKLP